MKISTKGIYGLRLIIFLAGSPKNAPIPLREIAKNQDISEKYLEQIVNILTKSGYVRSFRGANGGYTLAKEPENISSGEILRILEGSLAPVECTEDDVSECGRIGACEVRAFWLKLKDAINDVVDNTMISDFIN